MLPDSILATHEDSQKTEIKEETNEKHVINQTPFNNTKIVFV